MWFSHCDPPHVPTEESRTELWRNKLFSPFKFYFWILQSIISYVQGSQTRCAPSLSKAVNRIKQSNESLSQTVCLHNSLSFILHCRGRDHGLNKFLQNTLLKNRVRWLRCFTVMENDTIFSSLHCYKKQTSSKISFLKQSERFQRPKTNSTYKSFTSTKPLHEDMCWNSREEHAKHTPWFSGVLSSRAILTLVWINALQSLTLNPSNPKSSLSLTFDSSKISAWFSETS